MIEKQFGTEYGPPLQRGDKTACIVSLQAEIDRLGGVPAHRPMLPVSQSNRNQGAMRR